MDDMDLERFKNPGNLADIETVATKKLLRTILTKYQLPVFGIHGVSHWARVLENGVRLSALTGADTKVVILFSVFHDSKRQNEAKDDGHGLRGAKLAAEMRDSFLAISDNELFLLRESCELHTDGLVEGDITVQTCWDSDRLDLNRVGVKTDPEQLCTTVAKDPNVINWAMNRAANETIPEFVNTLWGFK